MAPFQEHTIALLIVAVAAVASTSPASSPLNAMKRIAAPTAQEQTINRPECPVGEVSSGWPSCRVAGGAGG